MDAEYEQILMLKNVTRTTGMLHEVQVNHLKYWPLMCTHAVKSSFLYDFENKTVIFDLEKTQGKKPKDLSTRLDLLSKYVQELLGEEYSVTINLKGKAIFHKKGSVNARGEERAINSRQGSDQ